MTIVNCAKWKIGRWFNKTEESYSSTDAKKKRYAIRHTAMNDIVRVSIYDTRSDSCLYKQSRSVPQMRNKEKNNKQFVEHIVGKLLYVDVREPTKEELSEGKTYIDKIKEAYVKLQVEVNELNYVEEAPIRAQEAAKEAAKIANTFTTKSEEVS
jgi:hypothetical protein